MEYKLSNLRNACKSENHVLVAGVTLSCALAAATIEFGKALNNAHISYSYGSVADAVIPHRLLEQSDFLLKRSILYFLFKTFLYIAAMKHRLILLKQIIVCSLLAAGIAVHGNCQQVQENRNEAEVYYRKAMIILNNTTHNTLSRSLAEEAIYYSNQAIALDPSQSKYFRARGSAYIHVPDYASALTNMNEALRLDSTNALAWMGRGIVLENTARFSEAEESYLKALLYDPQPASIYYNLGMLYGKWSKDSLSVVNYDKAIKAMPEWVSAYTNRGEQKLQMKLYSEAIKDFNRAIQLDSTEKMSYNNRGLCEYYLKQYQEAIADFTKALSIRLDESFNQKYDTDKYSLNNMANCWFALGNQEEACTCWKKAIESGYVYKPEWKQQYGIDDPKELVRKYCK